MHREATHACYTWLYVALLHRWCKRRSAVAAWHAEWEQKLIDYQKIHPEVVIIDAPLAIRKIGSRASMLASLGTAGFVVQVCIVHMHCGI